MPNQFTPKYEVIYQHYLSMIQNGELCVYDKLPSESEIGRSFGVSRITVVKALDMLSKDGYISKIQGSGSFVSAVPGARPQDAGLKLISLITAFQPRGRELSLIKVVEREISAAGYLLSVSNSNDDPVLERQLLLQVKNRADGIILYVSRSNRNEDIFYQMFEEKYPIVFIDKIPLPVPCDAVLPDNFAGGRLIGERLIQAGYTRFLLIFHQLYQFSSELHRFQGFMEALRQAGIPDSAVQLFTISATEKEFSEPVSLLKSLTEKERRSFAVFCCNDIITEHLLAQIRSKASEVLDEVAFAGFDGLFSPPSDVSFFTVQQNPGLIGLSAAHLLLERIQTPTLFRSVQTIPVEPVDYVKE